MNLHTRKQMAEGDGGGGGGGGNPPAFTYSDSHKEYVTTKGWKAVDDVITSNKNLETLLGADKAGRAVVWPKDESDKDGWKAIHGKLGVPEKPEGYGFAAADANDKNAVAFLSKASGWFHELGVPKAAATGLFERLTAYDKELKSAAQAEAKTKGDAELAALDTEWGTASAANKEAAKRFVRELGITEEQMSAIEGALGTATFMKMFHAGGKKLGEHGSGGKGEGGGGITREDAKTRLEEARAKRSKGEMSEADWFEMNGRLGPIAYPDEKAA
jgi:hypothetical protein